MENNIENKRLSCQTNNAQTIDWTKLPGFENNEGEFRRSLTHIGDLEGNSNENSIYGAEYMPTDIKTPYYERMITSTVSMPWLAQGMEATYMNRTKALNEDEPNLNFKITSIPKHEYGEFESDIEGFGKSDTQNLFFKIMCVLFLIVMIYFLMKEIK